MADEEKQTNPPKEESEIQIHTLETDMQMLGIEDATESKEEKPEEKAAQEPETKPDKPKTRTQKRIERQQRDNINLKDENSHLKEELAELKAKPAEEPKPKGKEVNIDDFESYDEYLDALTEEEDKPKEEKKEVAEEPKTPEPPAINQTALNDMFEDGNGDYKDFETKVRSKELVLSADVISEVLRTEAPSDLMYRLASNPEEAERLSQITDSHDLTVAIAKLEQSSEKQKPETPDVPTKTNAPKPITPVNGSSIKGLSIEDDDLSFEQHEALLNSQQNNTRGGFI